MADRIAPREQSIPSGDGARVIPAEFGSAAGIFGGESLMRRMMRDPWLGFADQLLRALILEGEHRIVPAIGEIAEDADPATRRDKRLADEIAEFHRRWIGRLRRPLRRTLWHSMEALAYGHKLAEIEWAVVETGVDAGALTPVDVAPKPRGAYTMVLDRANRIVAVRPEGARVASADVVPPTSLFVFSLGGRDDDPHGTPALERAYEAWYRKGCAKPTETKALAAFAGGLSWVESDAGTPGTMEVYRDGKSSTEHASTVVAREGAKIKTGTIGAFPPGWRFKQFAPATSFAAFDSVYGRADKEMVTAFLVAARSLMEAEFGSRADSQTAEGLNESIRDWIRGELCAAVRQQLLEPATIANFGDDSARLCPGYAIVTEERGDLGAVTNAVQAIAGAGVLTGELVDHLLSLVGVPEAVRRSVSSALGASGAPDSTEFAGEPEEETEDAAPEPKPAKLRAADRATGKIVARYDRSLRGLAGRWLDGRLTDSAFVDAFSSSLADGHGEAAQLGARLAGLAGERPPAAVREYVAATLSGEGDYLAELVEDVAAGRRSPAQARLAARRYAQRMGATVSAAFHEASPEGSRFWWRLGSERPCADCPRLARMSPYEKDELITRPREGETECQGGCQCRIVREDGACGPGPVALADYPKEKR